MLRALGAWLSPRTAKVVTGGAESDEFVLSNTLFQLTVIGPPLWAIFFADVQRALALIGFEDVLFADDLTCDEEFPVETCAELAQAATDRAQREVHTWGQANSVFRCPEEAAHSSLQTLPG